VGRRIWKRLGLISEAVEWTRELGERSLMRGEEYLNIGDVDASLLKMQDAWAASFVEWAVQAVR
jgi:hypothetical protein